MVRRTSWARSVAVDAMSCLVANRLAVLAVMSRSWGEMDAEADWGLIAAASTTPRRVDVAVELLTRRANRLRSVPAGHRSRRAASSRVSPSK